MSEKYLDLLFLNFLPPFWRYACFIGLGACMGTGLVVSRLSRATSYLSDAPLTCINCHVMNDAYISWQHGSHREVASCNDCHVPHSNPVAQWAFKGQDGLRHSFIFTARTEPQVLTLSTAAVPVVQSNCIRCHARQMEMVRLAGTEERTCWDCHNGFHGPLRSLSASPQEMRPKLPPAGLDIFKWNVNESSKNE